MILGASFSGQPSDQYWKQPWGPNFFLVLFPRVEGSLTFPLIGYSCCVAGVPGLNPVKAVSYGHPHLSCVLQKKKQNTKNPLIAPIAWGLHQRGDPDCPCVLFLDNLDLHTQEAGAWCSCSAHSRAGLCATCGRTRISETRFSDNPFHELYSGPAPT